MLVGQNIAKGDIKTILNGLLSKRNKKDTKKEKESGS
jgi:hypothetical protein